MILKILTTAAFLMLGTRSATAQNPVPPAAGNPNAQVKVSVGDTAAPPSWELSVAVAVNVAYGEEAGRVTMVLKYPAKALNYLKTKSTEKLRDAKFEFKASKPVISGDTGAIALEFLPGSGGKLLPTGTLAILVFKVAKDAPEKTYPMPVESIQAWAPLPGAGVLTAASARNATFIVTPPGLPILSCFFYMH
jgi:hypothetical protein